MAYFSDHVHSSSSSGSQRVGVVGGGDVAAGTRVAVPVPRAAHVVGRLEHAVVFSVPSVAAFAHLWSFIGAVALTLWPGPLVAVPALAMIGMGYGFVSGLTAAAIARYWNRAQFGTVSAQLYIAWCVAAVSLPVLAGWLFDRTQGYGAAVMIAAGVNIAGMLISLRLPALRTGA